MKPTIKISLFLLIFGCMAGLQAVAQQGYTYNQYMNNLTPLNPAYEAVSGTNQVSALVRKQWVGIQGSPSTVFFTGGLVLPSIKGNAGLIVSNDQAGIEKQFEALAFFVKTISLAENTGMSLSANAGIRSFNANYSELDANDPKFKNNVSQTSGLVGLGLMIHSPKFYAGISVPRISLQSGNTTQQIKPNFYAMGGYLFDAGTSVKLKPAVLFSYVSNLPFRTDVSVTAYLQSQLGIGLNYGSSKEMAGILSYIFKNNLSVGYSYQFAAGAQKLGTGANSTQEFSLTYRFGSKKGFSLL